MRQRRINHLVAAACLGALLGAARGEMVTRRLGKPPTRPPTGKAAVPRAKPPTGYVPVAADPPWLDGKLNDAAWKKARPLQLARTLDGTTTAPLPTEVLLLRDQKALYVAFRCTEPLLDRLVASRRAQDGAVWDDDSVEFFLSPAGGTYYHFGVNAVGSTYDAEAKDRSWNSGFKAAVESSNGAWTIEVVMPFASMIERGPVPAEWTANFTRNRRVTGRWEEAAWSPTYSSDSHVPSRFGKILFKEPPNGEARGPVKPVVTRESLTILPVADGAGVARFDLSEVPKGATVYRADLRIFRTVRVDGRMDEVWTDVRIYPSFSSFVAGGRPAIAGAEPLKLRAPWHDRFDATDAVRKWVQGKPNAGFFVKTCPFWNAEATTLDIWYEGRPTNVPPQASRLKAFHRAGQTFLTWREVSDPVGQDKTTWGKLKRVLDGLDELLRVRYHVYRHAERITPGNLHQAELLAEVRPLSCWNVAGRNIDRPIDDYIATHDVLMTGHWSPFRDATVDGRFGRDCPIDRFVIRQGDPPLASGTGLYVHTPDKPQKAYYAVVTAINGVQNTRAISQTNSLAQPVDESPAEPQPVLQGELPQMPYFNYDQKRLHFVRWLAPPLAHVPMQVHNWTVGVPNRLGKSVPLELSLHRDGRSYWRTQYRIERDSLVLCPYDFPIKTWWYGYHEAVGTLKSFRQGAIHPYTERRLLSFIRWARRTWPVDADRVLVTGCRGGASGSGALHLALRHPGVFSLCIAGHPVIDYATASRRSDRQGRRDALSMQAIWGKADQTVLTADGERFWQAHNMNRRITALPASAELPFLAISSDHGYEHCRRFYQLLLERRSGLIASFAWGGTRYVPVSRTATCPNVVRFDIRRNRPYLAVVSERAVKDLSEGKMGELHRPFRWRDVAETPARLEATIFRQGAGDAAADVTPRRCRKFPIARGRGYSWRTVAADGSTEVQRGRAFVDYDGLLVLKQVQFAEEPRRLIVTPVGR